ncbi:MAG: hypothetical protein HC895_03615 [Leptolyngbyaceae cyanobacterium SM1_3_5]|nr:hypothetical protein [Leptolyngbyaceae cyanobacterium SM1_3_5]
MPRKNPIIDKQNPNDTPNLTPNQPAPTTSQRVNPPELTPAQLGGFSASIALPWSIPVHDPSVLLPTDIYDPGTSSAPRMKRDEADRRIEDYHELIAAQEVADVGYKFISSVFKAHTSFQQAMGAGFVALRESLVTDRKQVAAATAVVDLNTEKLKFGRAVQLNQQANIRLSGEIEKTNLTQQRINEEINILNNDIGGLKARAQESLARAKSIELPAA